MDALAELALMTKAKLVFETADTFLSFPALSPISYQPNELNFSQVTSNQELQVFSEFCQLTNTLPGGVLFQSSTSSFLWDTYYDVLQSARVAQGSLTASQTAQLQQAQAYLYTQTPDGQTTDSPAVVAYNQYRDAWMQAVQNYKNAELTEGSSADPSARSHWLNVDEPGLRLLVNAASENWAAKGFKSQVDDARQIEQRYAAQDPQLKWATWSSAFNPDLDMLTDPNQASFALTTFAPSDILDQTTWPTFEIHGPDIPGLVSQAPKELSSIFSVESGSSEIDSISFDVCSVTLRRPWFHPEVFDARFWRFSDPTKQLSDGASPPHGTWPAYVTGLVLARNISIVSRSTGGAPPSPPIHRFFPIDPILLRAGAVVSVPPHPPVSPVLRPMPHLMTVVPTTEHPIVATRLNAMTYRALPIAVSPVLTEHRVIAESVVAETSEVVQPAAGHAFTTIPRTDERIRPGWHVTFPPSGGAVTPPSGGGSTPPSSGSSTPPATTTETPDQGQVAVLAFICKYLGKCPNPDPALTWGS